MLNINYTLLIQIANFLFLLLVLNFIAYRPIRGILNRRKQEISSRKEDAESWKQRAEKRSEELEENISATRKEAVKEKANIKDQGLDQEKAMLQEAHSGAEAKLDKVRMEIRDRTDQVSISLQRELEGFSREFAEKILGRGV